MRKTIKLSRKERLEAAYVEESWNPANYANPLYIVHYPDGETYSTMQRELAERVAREFNAAL